MTHAKHLRSIDLAGKTAASGPSIRIRVSQMRRFADIWVLILSFAVCLSSACAQSRFSAIDEIVNQAVVNHQLPGAVVIVGHRGRVVYRRAFGMRSLAPAKERMTIDTIFDM